MLALAPSRLGSLRQRRSIVIWSGLTPRSPEKSESITAAASSMKLPRRPHCYQPNSFSRWRSQVTEIASRLNSRHSAKQVWTQSTYSRLATTESQQYLPSKSVGAGSNFGHQSLRPTRLSLRPTRLGAQKWLVGAQMPPWCHLHLDEALCQSSPPPGRSGQEP